MKNIFIILLAVILLTAKSAFAEESMVPVPDGGKMIAQDSESKQIFIYEKLTASEAEAFYKKLFSDNSTKSWQEPKDFKGYIINDWGNEKWHSISIIDKNDSGIEIIIMKDSWTWIIGSLVIRFVGVLVILTALMLLIKISGAFFSVKKQKPAEQKS